VKTLGCSSFGFSTTEQACGLSRMRAREAAHRPSDTTDPDWWPEFEEAFAAYVRHTAANGTRDDSNRP